MDPAEGRRIVVAVDEGDESVHALRWCLANFATRGDTILLLYVRPSPPTYSVLDATGPVGYMFAEETTAAVEGYSRQVADAVVEKTQKLCALHGKENGEMMVEVKVAVGDARGVICEMVDKLGADVLVMGSHGYGLFKRQLHTSPYSAPTGSTRECERLLRQERSLSRSHREAVTGMNFSREISSDARTCM